LPLLRLNVPPISSVCARFRQAGGWFPPRPSASSRPFSPRCLLPSFCPLSILCELPRFTEILFPSPPSPMRRRRLLSPSLLLGPPLFILLCHSTTKKCLFTPLPFKPEHQRPGSEFASFGFSSFIPTYDYNFLGRLPFSRVGKPGFKPVDEWPPSVFFVGVRLLSSTFSPVFTLSFIPWSLRNLPK